MRLFVAGRPISQQRPRTVSKGGKTWAYYQRKGLAAWKDKLILAFRGAARGVCAPPATTPIGLAVAFVFESNNGMDGYALTQEDVDHCLTVIMDAAQKSGAIKNDRQIVEVLMDKRLPTKEWPEGVYVELLTGLRGPRVLDAENVFRL